MDTIFIRSTRIAWIKVLDRAILLEIKIMNNPHIIFLCRRNYDAACPMMRIQKHNEDTYCIDGEQVGGQIFFHEETVGRVLGS